VAKGAIAFRIALRLFSRSESANHWTLFDRFNSSGMVHRSIDSHTESDVMGDDDLCQPNRDLSIFSIATVRLDSTGAGAASVLRRQ
jgi:hypothetical protein